MIAWTSPAIPNMAARKKGTLARFARAGKRGICLVHWSSRKPAHLAGMAFHVPLTKNKFRSARIIEARSGFGLPWIHCDLGTCLKVR